MNSSQETNLRSLKEYRLVKMIKQKLNELINTHQ